MIKFKLCFKSKMKIFVAKFLGKNNLKITASGPEGVF
jgi:hypothetical protein